MRFAQKADRAPRAEPVDRLVRRTRRQLSAVTLLLVAGLLAGVGLATAAVETRLSDAAIDRTLRVAAASAISIFFAGQDDGSEADGTATVEPIGPDGSTAASDQPAAGVAETDDHPPESADTFFLVLDQAGALLSNPRRVTLQGLPDRAAVAAAGTAGEDWRTVSDVGIRVRLLTQEVRDQAGTRIGFLQSGFALTLHDEQTREFFGTIVAASLVGLLGAILVTLVVTRRALAPIRGALATERRFVAAASHELRAPVAVIRASAEILQREGLVAPEGRSTVDDVISESDRLSRLVGDLLALASTEAAAISLDLKPVDVRSFISGIAGRAVVMAQSRGARLVVEGVEDKAGGPMIVAADPDRLTQILLILIDNAIDHSPDGGEVRLALHTKANDGRVAVIISIIDQGPGVPAADRERIFEPFARLRGGPGMVGGTGLGLAIARLLANRQGAVLQVDEAPRGGAVFNLELPLTKQPHSAGA
jgi:signal transduction histidine kinase